MDTKYQKTIMTLPTGKFVWNRILQDVRFIPKGMQRSRFSLILTVKENNEQDAIAKVCRHLLKKISERKKIGHSRVVTTLVNTPKEMHNV